MFGKLRKRSYVSYCHPSDNHCVVTENESLVVVGNIDFINLNKQHFVNAETFTPSNVIANPSLMVNNPSFGILSHEDLETRVEQLSSVPQEDIDRLLSSKETNHSTN